MSLAAKHVKALARDFAES